MKKLKLGENNYSSYQEVIRLGSKRKNTEGVRIDTEREQVSKIEAQAVTSHLEIMRVTYNMRYVVTLKTILILKYGYRSRIFILVSMEK